ncbi:MAG: asparagine synthase (glutamine-hydrolyzing), partial [Phycisphaerales bacterium]|nr:asparagine synthase (glutamine-hydrolyzing) [Phycisphaerales bacterium]
CRDALPRMTGAMRHRGPDDTGHEFRPAGPVHLGLGQGRLSIIDLSHAGHQPMLHPESGDVLVFNGELYNYRDLGRDLASRGVTFQGHCDAEVVLHAFATWGPDCLARFEGMYAFAYYRAADHRLFLVRDHVGIKPLYIARRGDRFMFASEVRALLRTLPDPAINPAGLASLLAFGAVQGPDTFHRDIREFPAGSVQEIDVTTVLSREPSPPRRFWSYPALDPSLTTDAGRERLHELLDLAVRDHLVADVPVGVFLSSGLDSTIIAGLAAKHNPDVRAFTVGFAEQPDLSEAPLAAETARIFGIEHHDIQLTAQDVESMCRAWLGSQDQPSVDGFNVYLVAGAVARAGMKVALSGQGGDEVFGGYPAFADVPRAMSLMRRLRPVPRALRPLLARGLAFNKPAAYREKLRDMLLTDGSVRALYFQRRRMMSTGQLAKLGIHARALGLTDDFMPPDALADLAVDEHDPVACVSELESRYYMGNMLLRDGDANGMAHSLEIRVPLLDRRILEAFHAMPGNQRLPSGRADKHLLRTGFPELFRPALLQQSKRGFEIPIKRWLLGPLRDLAEESLARVRDLDLLDRRGVDDIWSTFERDPESQIWTRAFTLIVLGAALKHH